MNNKVVWAAIGGFIVGAATGGGVAYYITKHIEEKKAADALEVARREKRVFSTEDAGINVQEPKEVEEKREAYPPGKVPYHTMYEKVDAEDDIIEKSSIDRGDEKKPEKKDLNQPHENEEVVFQVISQDDFDCMESDLYLKYPKVYLSYFQDDDILIGDDIDDPMVPEDTIGMGIYERIIDASEHVLHFFKPEEGNIEDGVCYRITIDSASYEDYIAMVKEQEAIEAEESSKQETPKKKEAPKKPHQI